MKTTVAAATALLFAAMTGASAQDLPGKYNVEGKNVDGTPYSGTAEIVATSENTCRIRWETGSTTSEGICMRNGNAFAARLRPGRVRRPRRLPDEGRRLSRGNLDHRRPEGRRRGNPYSHQVIAARFQSATNCMAIRQAPTRCAAAVTQAHLACPRDRPRGTRAG